MYLFPYRALVQAYPATNVVPALLGDGVRVLALAGGSVVPYPTGGAGHADQGSLRRPPNGAPAEPEAARAEPETAPAPAPVQASVLSPSKARRRKRAAPAEPETSPAPAKRRKRAAAPTARGRRGGT